MRTSLLVVAFVLAAGAAGAQEQTGTLQGRLVDTSGAALPGVTVTVSGPTILGGAMIAVTTESGYRVPNIPIGTYTVTFELASFQAKKYEGVRIQTNTTFTLDAQLAVASIEESVTIIGGTPIIDTGATNVSFTFTKELMDTVPNARDVWAMVAQAPGLVTSTTNVGGTNTGNQLAFSGRGTDPRQNNYILNGANVSNNDGTGASLFYYDVDSFDEMQIESNSHGADVQTAGVVLNMVPKSGSNAFHGSGSVFYGGEDVQADNVDDELRARGVDRASNLKTYFDGGFDIGGPILRDKLWFWGAYRYQNIERFVTGTRNADGSFPIDRTFLWFPTVKVNWMLNRNHNVSGMYFIQQKKRFKSGLSALRPVETSLDQHNHPIPELYTVRDDWTASPRMLVSLKVHVQPLGAFQTRPIPGVDTTTTPARLDLATSVWSAAPPSELTSGRTMRSVGGTVNYAVDRWLGGRHDFKFGADLTRYTTPVLTTYPADHRLQFSNSAPLQVILFQSGKQNAVYVQRDAFVQDSWQVGRATVNLGLRWDRQTNSLPEEIAPKSRFFDDPVKQEETGNLVTWNTFAPRLGVLYDLTGDAKTLLKTSYSRYYWQLWTRIGSQATLAGDRMYTYGWSDPNNDGNFTTNELGTLLSVNDPATRPVTIDEDLKPNKTDEFTVAVVRELMANVSFSGTFIYRRDSDLDWGSPAGTGPGSVPNGRINTAISPADYTPITGTDPGPDGSVGTADDAGPLVFYEISAAKRLLSPNYITTRDGYTQSYRGFEATIQRRFTGRWQAVASITIGEQVEHYAEGSFQNPQDIDKLDGTRINSSLPYIGKVMGSYTLPLDITLSGFYQYLSGRPYTRTVNSSAAGLPRPLNQGNVAVLANERNTDTLDAVNLLDLRVNYDLKMGGSRLSLALDIFNALNINSITSINTQSGANYARIVDFIAPRILRFGVRMRF